MLDNGYIFVFGSNLSGIHGAGAAKFALKYRGAKMRQAFGLQGLSYAIPTKSYNIKDTLIPVVIQGFIDGFIVFATLNPEKKFQVTRIGCGLAGLKDEDIAPMFKDAPDNCYFDEHWNQYLGEDKRYWGSF